MSQETENPIEASVHFLTSCGFTDQEAKNLCAAVYDESPAALWEHAPIWIEWCGKVKTDYECIVSLAAQGIITVKVGPGGIEDLMLGLRTGVEVL